MKVKKKMKLIEIYPKTLDEPGVSWVDIHDIRKEILTGRDEALNKYIVAENSIAEYLRCVLSSFGQEMGIVVNYGRQPKERVRNETQLHGIPPLREYHTNDVLSIDEIEIFSRLCIREVVGVGFVSKSARGRGVFAFFLEMMRVQIGYPDDFILPESNKLNFFEATDILQDYDVFDSLLRVISR